MEIVEYTDSRYPILLKQIFDPPKRLYCNGDIGLLSMNTVSIVGTRNMTDYGRWVIDNFLNRVFSRLNIAVVSGMARGVDEYVHKTCLKRNIKTVAVIPVGVSERSQQKGKEVLSEMLEKGVVLSEYPSTTHPQKYMFPLRNRIIAGLSMNCIVIEAGEDSGSLITAKYALENGRNVYAIPGNINSLLSSGCNELIKQGAIPLNNINDFYEIFALKGEQLVLSK